MVHRPEFFMTVEARFEFLLIRLKILFVIIIVHFQTLFCELSLQSAINHCFHFRVRNLEPQFDRIFLVCLQIELVWELGKIGLVKLDPLVQFEGLRNNFYYLVANQLIVETRVKWKSWTKFNIFHRQFRNLIIMNTFLMRKLFMEIASTITFTDWSILCAKYDLVKHFTGYRWAYITAISLRIELTAFVLLNINKNFLDHNLKLEIFAYNILLYFFFSFLDLLTILNTLKLYLTNSLSLGMIFLKLVCRWLVIF